MKELEQSSKQNNQMMDLRLEFEEKLDKKDNKIHEL